MKNSLRLAQANAGRLNEFRSFCTRVLLFVSFVALVSWEKSLSYGCESLTESTPPPPPPSPSNDLWYCSAGPSGFSTTRPLLKRSQRLYEFIPVGSAKPHGNIVSTPRNWQRRSANGLFHWHFNYANGTNLHLNECFVVFRRGTLSPPSPLPLIPRSTASIWVRQTPSRQSASLDIDPAHWIRDIVRILPRAVFQSHCIEDRVVRIVCTQWTRHDLFRDAWTITESILIQSLVLADALDSHFCNSCRVFANFIETAWARQP